MEVAPRNAFDRATAAWDDATRLRVLEVLHEWGLSKSDPSAVIAVLLGHVTTVGKEIPAAIHDAGKDAVNGLAGERRYLEAAAGSFGAIADAIPARVEEAVRSSIPAMGQAFADRVTPEATAAIVTALAEIAAAEQAKTDAGLRRLIESATEANEAATAGTRRVAAAGARAAIMAGFWYPLVAALAIAFAGFAVYGPVHIGPAFVAGKRAQAADDLDLAKNAPKRWANYVRQYQGGH